MAESIHAGHRNRLRQRFLSSSFKEFSEHEILELLLFYAVPRKDTNELSHQLINRFGSLSKVLDAKENDLKSAGAPDNVIIFLKMLPKLILSYVANKNSKSDKKSTVDTLKNECISTFLTPGSGNVILSLQNARGVEVFFEFFSTGTTNPTPEFQKTLVELVMKYHAVSAVIAIKKDFGVVFPTSKDIQNALRYKYTLSRVNVHLMDYLIVSDKDSFSLSHDSDTIMIFK